MIDMYYIYNVNQGFVLIVVLFGGWLDEYN